MTSRFAISLFQTAVSPAPRKVSGGVALAVTALLAIGTAAPLIAQVTFDEVEAALSALEAQAVVPAPPVADLLPAPPPLSGGVDFLPILTDQACPKRLGDITIQADTLAAQSMALEAQALELNARFVALEERNRALEIDQDVTECPAAFLAAVEELQSDLAGGDLGALVQEAETISVCAQAGLQDRHDRMVALEASTDPNAANERLAVSGVLRRWATADVQVSRAVSSFVFFDQRRVRLETATGRMLQRCEILGGY